jgi:6-phosphogluconolactonase (cycloisomerase 2 family)
VPALRANPHQRKGATSLAKVSSELHLSPVLGRIEDVTMCGYFSRFATLALVPVLALSFSSCGSSSNGSGSNNGSGGSSGPGGPTGTFAAGVGGEGQSSAARFLVTTQVPGLTPLPAVVNSDGTLTAASANVGQYSVFNPMGMMGAIDPTGSFFYEAVEPGLWAFTIDRQNGNVSEISTSPYDQTVNFEAVAVDQLGKFVYAFGDGQVYAYTMQSGTGQLTAIAGSPFAASPSGEQFAVPFDRIAISQDDRFLYAGTSAGIFGYSIDATSGALTAISGSPFGASAGMAAALLAPSIGFLYETLTSGTSSAIYGYSIDSGTGALTALAGSPFGSSCSASNLTSPASGKFLFGASCGMYQINASTGALTYLFADPTSPYSSWSVFDPTGNFLWILSSQEPCFDCEIGTTTFQVDSSTGNLTQVQNSFFSMTNSEIGGIQGIAITQ